MLMKGRAKPLMPSEIQVTILILARLVMSTDAQDWIPSLDAPQCTEQYKREECPKYCNALNNELQMTNEGYLKGKCCKHAGRNATIYIPNTKWHAAAFTARAIAFQNCTGAKLTFVPCPSNQWSVGGYVKDDLDQTGGMYDAFATNVADFASFESHLEDLTPHIRQTPEIQWTDVLPAVRIMHQIGGKTKALPFDFDAVSPAWRQDLVDNYTEATGLDEPRTWEEFTDYVEYWHGKDLNDDGVPDYGLCAFIQTGKAGPHGLLMQIFASKVQYLGTKQGIWFEVDPPDETNPTATPLFDNIAFREALRLTRRLTYSSISQEVGIPLNYSYVHEDSWHTGSCASFIYLTGSTSKVTLQTIERTNEAGEVIWKPAKPGRRILPFGSDKVYDRRSKTMKMCTHGVADSDDKVQCPHIQPNDLLKGRMVNRVPYAYSVFQHATISIRKASPQETKSMLWDFIVFCSLNAAPLTSKTLQVTKLDPFRNSQIDRSLYVFPPWTDQMYEDLKDFTEFCGKNDNIALELSIPGYQEYLYKIEQYFWQHILPMECNTRDECRCRLFEGGKEKNPKCTFGFGDYPNRTLWREMRVRDLSTPGESGSISEDEFIANVIREWADLTSDNGGAFHVTNIYRQSLGLSKLSKPDATIRVQQSDSTVLQVLAIVFGAILFMVLMAGAGRSVYRAYKERLMLRVMQAQHVQNQINTGLATVKELGHPMVLMSSRNFIDISFDGLLGLHEGFRDKGKLLMLDTCKHVRRFQSMGAQIVFYSYQWLSWTRPGPDSIQHDCMKDALSKLSEKLEVSTEQLFIWLDILSIPQWHVNLKKLAVDSLYVYASFADILVIIAPDSIHQQTKNVANADSYKDRTWCRAEQVGHACKRGVDHMYLQTGAAFEKVDRSWIETVCCIFDGQMTCCRLNHKSQSSCDRESLVPTLMGLYFEMYTLYKTNGLDDVTRPTWELMQSNKEQIFPKTFLFKTEEGAVTRQLFSDFIERIESTVDIDTKNALSRINTSAASQGGQGASAHNNRDSCKLIVSLDAPADKAIQELRKKMEAAFQERIAEHEAEDNEKPTVVPFDAFADKTAEELRNAIVARDKRIAELEAKVSNFMNNNAMKMNIEV